MIKVTVQGKKTQKVNFTPGMTVGDALKQAKVEVKDDATITVNNTKSVASAALTDGAIVVIVPKVSNG